MFYPNGLITLLTDFGERDGFVGTMKAVIRQRYPLANLVDLAHELPPQDLWAARYVLTSAVPHFPAGTIHLVVVDPEVGSARQPLLVLAGGQALIGPDNGLLTNLPAPYAPSAVLALDARRYWLSETSASFHGRDIFAPVAAALVAGVPPAALGTPHATPRQGPWPSRAPAWQAGVLRGQIQHVDRYGNAISDLPASLLRGVPADRLHIQAGSLTLTGLASHYAAVPIGQPLALLNSAGWLELAIRQGHAAECYGLQRGSEVTVSVAQLA